jgi:UDP-N-acetylglucosamine diphosphorylase/glucosamine-1-phosphate N-acetyltransferase
MQTILFNNALIKELLYPITLNRNAEDVLIGIYTIKEKWMKGLSLYPSLQLPKEIPANLVPSIEFFKWVLHNSWEFALTQTESYRIIEAPWQIAAFNDWALRADIQLHVKHIDNKAMSSTVQVLGDALFVEEGLSAECCTFNTLTGPIYIAKNVTIMEGVHLRGPLSIGEGAVIKMGAVIYGATTIGPYCVIGGEVKNSVIMGYSNKAHEGYLGDAVIGSWCNLGAGTSCSNVKNTASEISVWNMHLNKYVEAGKKCGLLMGDYSRSAINTSFNTGTVVGICSNVFQTGQLTPKFISNFAWGINEVYQIDKVFIDIQNWMNFKHCSLENAQKEILYHLYNNKQS